MKKRTHIRAAALILMVVMLVAALPVMASAKPANIELDGGNFIITDLAVTDGKGGADLNNETITQWHGVYVEIKFKLAEEHGYGDGSEVKIELPEEFLYHDIGSKINIEIKDEDDNIVANAVADVGKSLMTLKFTDYVTSKSNITGQLWFYIRIAEDADLGEQTLTFSGVTTGYSFTIGRGQEDPGETVTKWGSFLYCDENDSGYWNKLALSCGVKAGEPFIVYGVRVNASGKLSNITEIKDTLEYTQGKILKDSFEMYRGTTKYNAAKGEWEAEPGKMESVDGGVDAIATRWEDIKIDVKNNDNGYDSFTVSISGGTNDAFQIGYIVKWDDKDTVPTASGVYKNTVVVTGTQSTADDDLECPSWAIYIESGGSISGDTYSVELTKVKKGDASTKLTDAVFSIWSVDAGGNPVKSLGTLAHKGGGVYTFEGLLKRKYAIIEETAPSGGYVLDKTPHLIDMEDETPGVVVSNVYKLTVENELESTTPKEYDAALQKWVSEVTRNTAGDVYKKKTPDEPNKDTPKVKVGDKVTFAIKVINQCDQILKITEIVDYMPSGYEFAAAGNDDWTQETGYLKYTPPRGAIELAPQNDTDDTDEAIIYLTLTVKDGSDLVNYAEIAGMTDKDGKGEADGVADKDSTPNNNPNDDMVGDDNEIGKDGKKGEDEDDHDFASVELEPAAPDNPYVPPVDPPEEKKEEPKDEPPEEEEETPEQPPEEPPVRPEPPTTGTTVPNDDGSYTELDENGVPLGTWTWDEELEEWIFEAAVPLAGLVPATGDRADYLTPMLIAAASILGLGLIAIIKQRKRVK